MRKLKQALSLLLSLIMVLGMFTVIPFTASAEGTADVYVSTWDDLQDALDDNGNQGRTIALSGSIDSGEDTLTLDGSGKSMTIDLANFEVDMKRTSKGDNKHVFEAKGGATLTIKNGTIKGGWANNGGGIYVTTNSKVILENVTVTGNKAGTDGGAVYVKGVLEMTNSTLSQNSAGDTGGGIYVSTDGSFTLTDSVITQNHATKTGGGINMHLKSDSTISGCQITYNTAGSYGGGIRMDAQDKTLTINSSTSKSTLIDHNTASDDGGGIYLHYGTINMTGGSISNNKSNKDGGGVKVTPRTAFTANGVIINENEARDEEGGGVKNQGTTTLTNCTISKNSADKQGGGIFNDEYDGSEGDLTLENCTVSLNTSDSTGGGVYSDKLLKLKGGTFTQNTAGDGKGCGIFIGKDSDPTQIEGGLIVDGNSSSTKGQELLLRPGKTITVTGALTNGAKIGVTMDDGIGTFTTGYNTYNNGTAPSTYFYSPDGFGVGVDGDGEVQLMTSWPDLQTEINASTADEPIVLNHNYTAASDHDRLKIDGNRTVTIDLNGYTLNRNLTSEKTNGHVIEVFGGSTLIIKDSSTDKTGTITGGYSARGGGIYVNKDATLKVESGTISGNNADCDGGGIYVAGDLIMSGGVITENMAYDSGGAIYVSSDGKMDLENVQITRNIGEDIGGAINIHMRADSTIKKCTITGNEATDDVGGGIHMNAKGRKLTITDSNIDNNSSADDGAGIYIKWGTVEMSGGSIKGNHTLGDGAGVKVTPTTTFIADDVDICNNTSEEEQGGGVKNQGTTTLKNCTITGNSAADTGGGVFNDATDGSAGDLTIESCTIAGNSADKGGGIYTDEKLTLKGSNVIGAATVNGESIPGNSASNKGGGICINGGAIFTKLQGSLVMTGNTAALGNDLYIEKDNKFELTGAITGTNIGYVDMSKPGRFTKNYSTYHSATEPSTFFGTDARAIPVIWSPDDEDKEAYLKSNWPELQKKINNAAENGGTVELDTNYTAGSADRNLSIPKNKTVTIDLKGYTINRNLTSNPYASTLVNFGAAIIVYDNASLTIKDSSANGSGTITGGCAGMGGGIIIGSDATCTIEGGSIKGNKATYDGGGIYVMGTLNMTGGTISDNKSSGTGGGIYVNSEGKISLSNVSITDNEADNTGGGINMHLGANTTFSNCTISDNTAGDVGGGLRMDAKDKKLTITNTNIENNKSNDDGAGIFLQYGTIEMTGGKISGNTSGNDGGGVKVTPKTTFKATNVTISNNTSSTEQGGGIKNQGTTELTNCTVKNNSANENGGGIFNDGDNGSAGKLTLDSCTITNNKSSANGGGVYSDEVLTIKGSTTITDNFASDKGGGIFVGKGSDDDTKIEGALVIKDNKATTFGNDLFLNTGKNDFLNTGIKLCVTGALTGSTIKVDTDVGTGTLTKDYSKYNSDAPSSFFVPTKGYDVVLKDGEAVITSSWSTLKKNIENYTGTEPFKLDGDYTASQSDKKIEIKSGKNITIDLNGHTLNRNRMSSGDNGHVFEVFGTLTITDSSDDGTGTITGGWAKRGGGVNVSSDGTFILEGGTITGNRAGDHGGGVYVHGTFIMRGGKIEKNRSEETGGGIELDKNSTLRLEGGSITGNEAIGEQIDTDEDDQTNKSEGRGGAVMSDKNVSISIKGNPVIKNNRASLTGSDIYLLNGIRLNVTGALTEGASVSVAMENDWGAFTNGYSTHNGSADPAQYFKSTQGYAVALKNGEAELLLDTSYGETDYE